MSSSAVDAKKKRWTTIMAAIIIIASHHRPVDAALLLLPRPFQHDAPILARRAPRRSTMLLCFSVDDGISDDEKEGEAKVAFGVQKKSIPPLFASVDRISEADDDEEENETKLSSHDEEKKGASPLLNGASLGETFRDAVVREEEALLSRSILLLNLVAILWGSQHAVIKSVVEDTSDPAAFTLLRFGLAALLAAPYTPGLLFNNNNNKNDEEEPFTKSSSASVATTTWRWGLEMGLWMFLGFAFQAVGLEFTTAQRSGFLLYLNVKFVPFLARILLGRSISAATWISALVAFTGTGLLAFTGGSGGGAVGGSSQVIINVGDLWSIAAAMASAMFILRLEQASAEARDAAGLNAACLWVVTLLAAAWTFAQGLINNAAADPGAFWYQLTSIATSHPFELIYLGGVTTALANWIQTKAQRDVSAERASVIYAMDPVYGAVFSYWLLGETLAGIQGWIGAGLISAAAATNAFLDLGTTGPKDDTTSASER
jgi:drug/metabolite transporter (DMT)-like permease